jgi:hypothetical protein
MTPGEAKSIAAFLIADFENEMQTTQRVLAAVPADRLEYQPDAKAKTGLGLARHIALEDEWLLNCVTNGEFTPPPDDSDECGIMNPTDAHRRDIRARVAARPGDPRPSARRYRSGRGSAPRGVQCGPDGVASQGHPQQPARLAHLNRQVQGDRRDSAARPRGRAVGSLHSPGTDLHGTRGMGRRRPPR